jgi:8-oxo-dGTP pyrophosphatase MutT (NUDIX family)
VAKLTKEIYMTKRYVLGFVMDERKEKIVLIHKNRPDFQAGKLNGLGGKIEEGETPEDAIKREIEEESGLVISDNNVTHSPPYRARLLASSLLRE